MKIISPAKINLFLSIRGVRDDGYHLLDMINAKVSLHDEILIDRTDSPGVVLSCSDPTVPVDERNTVHKAASRFLTKTNADYGVSIHIEKRIPHGAGLGGGSGNAGSVLAALNNSAPAPLARADLMHIAESIGADVPFFLEPGCCFVGGVGEDVQPLRVPSETAPLSVVIVSPDEAVSTRDAYSLWDQYSDRETRDPDPLLNVLREGRLGAVAPLLFNSFEAVIFPRYAIVQKTYRVFCELSPTPPRMTGSGSNLFSLHESDDEALRVAESLTARSIRAQAHRLIL